MNVAPYRKLIVALTAAFAVLGSAVADSHIDSTEAIEVVLAFLAAYGVYRIPNEDPE